MVFLSKPARSTAPAASRAAMAPPGLRSQNLALDETVPRDTPAAPDPQSLPVFPVPPPPPKHMSVEQRQMELVAGMAPYYLVPGFTMDTVQQQTALAVRETARRVYINSAPFHGLEIPLPPGRWAAVAIGPEAAAGAPAAAGVLLARLDQHVGTGFVLVRGNVARLAAGESLAANRICAYPRHYASDILVAPSRAGEACWYVAQATFPTMGWNLVLDPPALGIALKTMARSGDGLPAMVVGTTYFRRTPMSWLEVTYFFDPMANGVGAGGPMGGWMPADQRGDLGLQHVVGLSAAWLQQLLPLLDHLGPTRIPASVMAKANREAPE